MVQIRQNTQQFSRSVEANQLATFERKWVPLITLHLNEKQDILDPYLGHPGQIEELRRSRKPGHDGTVKNVSDTESSDVELLTTIIAGGNARARQTATQLLQQFGSLRALLHASDTELSRIDGLGRARLQRLRALPILARRYFEESLPCGVTIRSPSDTESFLKARMQHLGHELFCCLYLDNRHRVLRFDELFRGTIDGTSVYPREVVKEALSVNAAAVILAHNHPSGVAEPSQADERITLRLKSALELVDIRLLDHLIVGNGAATSLASRGLL